MARPNKMSDSDYRQLGRGAEIVKFYMLLTVKQQIPMIQISTYKQDPNKPIIRYFDNNVRGIEKPNGKYWKKKENKKTHSVWAAEELPQSLKSQSHGLETLEKEALDMFLRTPNSAKEK